MAMLRRRIPEFRNLPGSVAAAAVESSASAGTAREEAAPMFRVGGLARDLALIGLGSPCRAGRRR